MVHETLRFGPAAAAAGSFWEVRLRECGFVGRGCWAREILRLGHVALFFLAYRSTASEALIAVACLGIESDEVLVFVFVVTSYFSRACGGGLKS